MADHTEGVRDGARACSELKPAAQGADEHVEISMLRCHDDLTTTVRARRSDRAVPGRTGRRASRLLMAAALMLGAGLVAPALTSPATGATRDDTPWRLPEMPPRCTRSQADSGDVSGCLLAFYNDPADTGWGEPPAPGVGPGWDWQGYTYNGSPALATWENTYIASNTTAIAGFGPGYLETHTSARALFEGFLHEISTGGYDVNDVGGYTFRCTSGNGGWDCPSGDPDDLSNHAWGLAIDMNAGTNPIRSYSGDDGETACKTPIQTDLPRWVIQTAERWGLYWGGYGWSDGCQTVETKRSTVYRDPPHFEFRGTPAQATAIAAFNRANGGGRPSAEPDDPTVPDRDCFEAYTDDGEPTQHCPASRVPQAGSRLAVGVDAPDAAVAAVINLTAVESAAAGHLVTEGCGPTSPERATSTVNFAAGETAAAMAIVPLDDHDRFCVWRSTAAHHVVDVVGFLTDAGDRLWYDPSLPRRLTDTRRDGVCTRDDCRPGRVPAGGIHTVATADDAPRLVNLTVADQTGPGHASAGRCDAVATSTFSNINYVPGVNRANMALLDNGTDGSCVWVHADTHVIVDELGRLLPDSGLGWKLREAERLLDTRRCTSTWCDGRVSAGEAHRVELELAGPAAITLTVDAPVAPGHAWVGGCDELVDGMPPTSNVNYVPGKATANLAIVSPDAGAVCVWVHAEADLIIDVRAELVEERMLGLRPVTPTRVQDTRRPT